MSCEPEINVAGQANDFELCGRSKYEDHGCSSI